MTFREKALRFALREIGVSEDPPRSNNGPRVRKYLAAAGLGPGFPWCMAFVNYVYEKAGCPIVHPNEASVGFFEDWARKNGYLVERPERGDIVCYRFDADNWPDHVGIVEEVKGSRIVTVEGNTSLSNDANGGSVMRRNRVISRCRFVRVPGDVPVAPKPPVEPSVARIDVQAGNVVLTNQNPESPVVQSRLRRLFNRFGSLTIRKSK